MVIEKVCLFGVCVRASVGVFVRSFVHPVFGVGLLSCAIRGVRLMLGVGFFSHGAYGTAVSQQFEVPCHDKLEDVLVTSHLD